MSRAENTPVGCRVYRSGLGLWTGPVLAAELSLAGVRLNSRPVENGWTFSGGAYHATCGDFRNFAFLSRERRSTQQLTYAVPITGPTVVVPPYGVPCGGYYPF